jgi:3-isopropylmalate/(R)-2-methylmalate dehydratase small subunit
LECPEAAEDIRDSDELEVDIETGTIRNLTTGRTYQAMPIPEFMRQILNAGGLINYVRQKLGVGA